MTCIDFHAHILPGLDHGCRGVTMAMRQLTLLADAGIDCVCATSHFYPHVSQPEPFLQNREKALTQLAGALGTVWDSTTYTIPGKTEGDIRYPSIRPGAEVLICDGLQHMEELPQLCLAGTDLLLLEMPLSAHLWSKQLVETVYALAESGVRPVMAHVDRYPRQLMEPILQAGIPGQINVDSLAHMFPSRHLLTWMDKGWIAAVGNDLHGDDAKSLVPFTKVMHKMKSQMAGIMSATERLLAGE